MVNIIIRILIIFSFTVLTVYWYVSEQSTEKSKPKQKRKFSLSTFVNAILPLFTFLICLQALGLQLFTILYFPKIISFFGIIVVIAGLGICILSRKTLGDNWTRGQEYQIKNNHKLITEGIYSIIRHPIYFGFTLMFIGSELALGSYLFISFFAFFIAFYFQGKREEKILQAHFGKNYEDYMKRTKMLIPFVI